MSNLMCVGKIYGKVTGDVIPDWRFSGQEPVHWTKADSLGMGASRHKS